MNKHIDAIYLNFENCERAFIPKNYIGDFSIDGIVRVVRRVACNSIYSYSLAKEMVLEVFPGITSVVDGNSFANDNTNTIDRVCSCNDIVSVDIVYDDGEKEEIYFEYDTGDVDVIGGDNLNQSSFVSKFGTLYVVISKDKKVESVFKDEIVNDEESLLFRMSMVDSMASLGDEIVDLEDSDFDENWIDDVLESVEGDIVDIADFMDDVND